MGTMSTVRQYAGIVGVVLVLTGILGLVLGDQSLGGLLNIDLSEDKISSTWRRAHLWPTSGLPSVITP